METVTISKATMSGNVRTLTQIRKEDLVHESCRQLEKSNLRTNVEKGDLKTSVEKNYQCFNNVNV